MDFQSDMTPHYRAGIIDVFVKWQYYFQLRAETLFLAVYIFDKFLSIKKLDPKQATLIFVTSVFIAAKFEEIRVVRLRNFLQHCNGDLVSAPMVLNMEKQILELLDYQISYICPYDFLKRLFYIMKSDLDKCELIRHPRLLLPRDAAVLAHLDLLPGLGEGLRGVHLHGGDHRRECRQGAAGAVHQRELQVCGKGGR